MLALNARLLETIDITEKRLRCNLSSASSSSYGGDAAEEANDDDDDDDDDLFSPLSRILYTTMLGDSYYALRTEFGERFYPSFKVLREFEDRAEAAFRSAVNLSARIGLEPTNPLRLLSTCSLCKVLVVLRGRRRRARHIALKLFTAASLHSHVLSDDAARLLQILRDEYVPILSHEEQQREQQREEAYSSDESSEDEDEDGDGEFDSDDDDDGAFDEDGNRIDDGAVEEVNEQDGGEEGGGGEEKGEGEGEGEGAGGDQVVDGLEQRQQQQQHVRDSAMEDASDNSAAESGLPQQQQQQQEQQKKKKIGTVAPKPAQTPTNTPKKARPESHSSAKTPGVAKTPPPASKGKGTASPSPARGASASAGAGASAKKGKSLAAKASASTSANDKGTKKSATTTTSTSAAAVTNKTNNNGKTDNNFHLLSKHARKAVAMVKGLRKIVATSQTEPILLEADPNAEIQVNNNSTATPSRPLPSGSEFHRALFRIFSVYVRGAALPAHAAADYKVTVDGQQVSFATYLLKGPYMSFRGLCVILRDFGIAKLPSKRKSPSFPAIHDPPGAVREFRASGPGAAQPPLTIREAVILFIECSRSAHPALSSAQFVATYAELAAQERASNVNLFKEQVDVVFSSTADGSSTIAKVKTGTSPWDRALEWAAADREEWEGITCGINFHQFLDFLGKAALVAYSAPRFDAIFPTPTKKIEHFLSAHLGLLDARRWLAKVDSRILALKYTIDGMTSKAISNWSEKKG